MKTIRFTPLASVAALIVAAAWASQTVAQTPPAAPASVPGSAAQPGMSSTPPSTGTTMTPGPGTDRTTSPMTTPPRTTTEVDGSGRRVTRAPRADRN